MEEAEEVAVRRLSSSLWFISLIFTGRLKNITANSGLFKSLNGCFCFCFLLKLAHSDGTLFPPALVNQCFAAFLMTSEPENTLSETDGVT